MPGYENAPATKLLATHCCCCGRALVDAESVERGVGPDCAEKYGFFAEVNGAARAEANVIVHRIAAAPKAETVAADIARVQALGLGVLAAKLMDRLTRPVVKVEEKDGYYVLHTPYNANFVTDIKAVPGRRWNPTEKVWSVPAGQKKAAYATLVKHFTGSAAVGPKGPFVIGAPTAPVAPKIDTEFRLSVEGPPTVQDEADYHAQFRPSSAYAALPETEKARIEAEEAAKEARKAAMEDGDHDQTERERQIEQLMENGASYEEAVAWVDTDPVGESTQEPPDSWQGKPVQLAISDFTRPNGHYDRDDIYRRGR